MKTLRILMLPVLLLLMSFNAPSPGLTDAERTYAIDLMKATKETLLSKVKGLSAAQLNFKATPESWSVAECVEHIAITEGSLFGMCQGAMKVAADPSKRSEVKLTDAAIAAMITDRTNKVKTNEAFVPSNKFGSFEATLKEFTTKRDNNMNYVKTTSDDLRNHYNDFAQPFGKIDAYQTLVFMAAHSRRHTMQIDEVMANPAFPKK